MGEGAPKTHLRVGDLWDEGGWLQVALLDDSWAQTGALIREKHGERPLGETTHDPWAGAEPGPTFLLGFPKEGRLWDGTAGRGFPPTYLSSLYPLDCSKKDLGECGALAKLLKEGQEPGDAWQPTDRMGLPAGRAVGAKKAGFPSLRDFSEMEGSTEPGSYFNETKHPIYLEATAMGHHQPLLHQTETGRVITHHHHHHQCPHRLESGWLCEKPSALLSFLLGL